MDEATAVRLLQEEAIRRGYQFLPPAFPGPGFDAIQLTVHKRGIAARATLAGSEVRNAQDERELTPLILEAFAEVAHEVKKFKRTLARS